MNTVSLISSGVVGVALLTSVQIASSEGGPNGISPVRGFRVGVARSLNLRNAETSGQLAATKGDSHEATANTHSLDPSLQTGLSQVRPLRNNLGRDEARIGESSWSTAFNDIDVTKQQPGGSISAGAFLQQNERRIGDVFGPSAGGQIGDIFQSRIGR